MADKKISALTGASTPLAGTEVLPIVQSGATVKVAVSDLTAGRTVGMASLGVGTAATATRLVNIASTAGVAPLVAVGPNGYLLIDNSGGGTNIYSSNVAHVFEGVSGGNVLTLDCVTKNISVTSGNIAISTSGKGIDFSATAGTGTSELLADYEEGTFTITISGSTSGSGTVSGIANYIKVGKVVTINVAVSNVTFPTYAGNLQIGLPYAAKSDADGQLFGAPMYFFPLANWTTGVLFAGWIPRVTAGASVITFQLQQVNGDRQTLATNANTTTSATAGLYTSFSLTYLSAT
jgi:hypothetical protein